MDIIKELENKERNCIDQMLKEGANTPRKKAAYAKWVAQGRRIQVNKN